jgi:adenosylcobinamide-GDP ribazoletransferase
MRGLFVAIQFLTRIPVPSVKVKSAGDVSNSAGFFPAVGLIVGGGGCLLYYLLKSLLPPSTCVLLVLVYSAVITNAFHEDGLADSFDGLGGAWTREQSLKVMRDSRIGTFGALALIFLVLGKYNLLSLLEWPQFWRWYLFANVASRWSILPLCMFLDYVREEGQGKLVARRIGPSSAFIGTLTIAAAAVVFPVRSAVTALAVACAVPALAGLYYRHRLGGITGDCLGAATQLAEIALYIAAVLMTARA